MPDEGVADRVSGRDIPHADRAIAQPRYQVLTVGGESQAQAAVVRGERIADLRMGGAIPQADRLVWASGSDEAPVGAERDGQDTTGVTLERPPTWVSVFASQSRTVLS